MLGSVQHAPCGRQNIRAACEALTTAIAAGVFLRRSEAEWELAFHYPTLADWIEFTLHSLTSLVRMWSSW